jgi:hypothetical protein
MAAVRIGDVNIGVVGVCFLIGILVSDGDAHADDQQAEAMPYSKRMDVRTSQSYQMSRFFDEG